MCCLHLKKEIEHFFYILQWLRWELDSQSRVLQAEVLGAVHAECVFALKNARCEQ